MTTGAGALVDLHHGRQIDRVPVVPHLEVDVLLARRQRALQRNRCVVVVAVPTVLQADLPHRRGGRARPLHHHLQAGLRGDGTDAAVWQTWRPRPKLQQPRAKTAVAVPRRAEDPAGGLLDRRVVAQKLRYEALRKHQALQVVELLHGNLIVPAQKPQEAVRGHPMGKLLRQDVEKALCKGLQAAARSLQEDGLATQAHVAAFVGSINLPVVAPRLELDACIGKRQPLQVLVGHLVAHPPQTVGERGVHRCQIL
mmetsp:Transcript_25517/g.73706  ORF Transcript_25517/g.73706 Transcript_25517/m.73706 type:complete len:254 (-) Transcript_25517:2001-2762(-)